MFCSNCGEKIEDSSSFCKNCGAKITNNDKTERVQLKCKECGGVMTADSSNKTLHCPYCGSSEVIVSMVMRLRLNASEMILTKK